MPAFLVEIQYPTPLGVVLVPRPPMPVHRSVAALGLHIQGDSSELRPTLHPLRGELVQSGKMIRCCNERNQNLTGSYADSKPQVSETWLASQI